ncbi:hypothetical protein D9M69_692940 [compost metagenome]
MQRLGGGIGLFNHHTLRLGQVLPHKTHHAGSSHGNDHLRFPSQMRHLLPQQQRCLQSREIHHSETHHEFPLNEYQTGELRL